MWITAVAGDSGDVLADRRLGERIQPLVTTAADAILLAELIPQGSTARRRIHTLDGGTLAPRGILEVEGHASPFALNPPGSALVVTTSRNDGVLAVDATTGALAWPVVQLRGRSVKNVLSVPGGVIVTDDGDNVRRIDAATGEEVWVRPLAGDSTLGYNGEAAEGDLVVATLVPSQGGAAATAVGIDAATGDVRWRTPLPIEGRALPRPEVLQNVVAYELNVRKSDGYDCRVVLLDRTTGTVSETLHHPRIGTSLQRAFFQGPYVILWAPPRADIAIYGGSKSGR
jgi:outer membrane protein assembly factor BamB